MTEHKFGTWYPIDELKEFDKDVLFWDGDSFEKGCMTLGWTGEPVYKYNDYEKNLYPSHFMPLPPRPGEGE
jgi:hypothetical protein